MNWIKVSDNPKAIQAASKRFNCSSSTLNTYTKNNLYKLYSRLYTLDKATYRYSLYKLDLKFFNENTSRFVYLSTRKYSYFSGYVYKDLIDSHISVRFPRHKYFRHGIDFDTYINHKLSYPITEHLEYLNKIENLIGCI